MDGKSNCFLPFSPPQPNTIPFPMESFPLPLELLYETPVPPFLFKTFDLVDDPSLDAIISWGAKGESFVVWDPVEFARTILPGNFKHNNFSSFVRQLNTYGFRKIDTEKWEFANEGFVSGQRHLLKNIQRRKSPTSHQTGRTSGAELEDEIARLRKERSLMMREVAELQHQQRGTVKQIEYVNEKLEAAEKRQKQMVSFLAKMFQNPVFVARLKQMREKKSITSSRTPRKFVKHQPHLPGASSSFPKGQIVEQEPDFIVMPSGIGSPLSVWPLQDIGENTVFDAEDVPLQDFGLNELDMVHELLHTPEKGTSVADSQYFLSFSEDLAMEKSIPEFSIQETEDVKVTLTGDMWNIAGAGMSSSCTKLWGNLSGYDVPELGVSSGLSDTWNLGLLHPAGSSGNEKWPEDFPLENPDSPAYR